MAGLVPATPIRTGQEPGEKLIVQTTQRLDPAGGGSVGLSFDAADAFFFDADSGQRLR